MYNKQKQALQVERSSVSTTEVSRMLHMARVDTQAVGRLRQTLSQLC